mmetsp:Transcript_57108/g.105592  ORF Transcript_57108/g.105592 Transcript_57108/m.105592 type:complete len:345 (+) Transcript_57108:87-1121(+)
MPSHFSPFALACLTIGVEILLVHSAKVADADEWAREPSAEAAFCPYLNAVSRMQANIIDVLRHLSNTSSTVHVEDAWQKRKHQWVLSEDATPKEQLLHLFTNDGNFLAETCAVVSSSGVLLSHTHGPEIDSADLVWRFNDAEVDPSIADYVGTREDVRVLNDQQSDYLIYPGHLTLNISANAILVMQRQRGGSGIRPYRLMQMLHEMHPMGNFVQGDRYVNLVGQQVMDNAFGQPESPWNVQMSRHLTTGFQGILMAATLCKEVRTYGFVNSPHTDAAPYHYYGEKMGNAAEKGKHATYDQEKLFWRMIATNSDIDATDKAVFPGFPALQCDPFQHYTALLRLL